MRIIVVPHSLFILTFRWGWNSNPGYNRFRDDVCTPENVQKAFAYAKEHIDTHPAHSIDHGEFLERTEASYLQPDDLYGYGYFEAIKKAFAE